VERCRTLPPTRIPSKVTRIQVSADVQMLRGQILQMLFFRQYSADLQAITPLAVGHSRLCVMDCQEWRFPMAKTSNGSDFNRKKS
jgi:hypothetical protein